MSDKVLSAEICKARGGARAIASMTFDDGVAASSFALLELLRRYDLSATLFLVPTRIMGIAPYSSGYLDMHDVHNMMATGRIDAESHSFSHLYLAVEGHVDYKAENCTDENRKREIPGSREWLEGRFKGYQFIAFGVPGGSYDARAKELVMSTFYSSRVGHVVGDEVQTLTPRDAYEGGGWYSLKSKWLGEGRIPDVLAYLDRCVEEGGWFITGCHNVVGTEIGKNNYEISLSALSTVLDRMAEYKSTGKLWVTTFAEATKYLREYEASHVKTVSVNGETEVGIEMKDKTPRGLPLTPSVFNLPLSVRVTIPEEWQSAECEYDGNTYPCEILTDENGKYLYVDIKSNTKATVRRLEQ